LLAAGYEQARQVADHDTGSDADPGVKKEVDPGVACMKKRTTAATIPPIRASAPFAQCVNMPSANTPARLPPNSPMIFLKTSHTDLIWQVVIISAAAVALTLTVIVNQRGRLRQELRQPNARRPRLEPNLPI